MSVTSRPRPKRAKQSATPAGRPAARLSPRQTSAGLLRLLRTSRDPRALARLCDAVALHPAATDAVLKAIIELSGGSDSALNAVATSGRASEALLQDLAKSHLPDVREHARFNLLTKRLARSKPAEVIATVKRSRGMPRAALESYLAFYAASDPETLAFLSKRALSDDARMEATRRLAQGRSPAARQDRSQASRPRR
jgi:hypothetical protein